MEPKTEDILIVDKFSRIIKIICEVNLGSSNIKRGNLENDVVIVNGLEEFNLAVENLNSLFIQWTREFVKYIGRELLNDERIEKLKNQIAQYLN
jgi:hypothetical protein